MSQIIKRRIIIHGRVHGVGYRRFTQAKAIELNLLGWVRNLKDGSVEVKCQGLVDKVEVFIQKLSEGPPLSTIREIVAQEIIEDISVEGFLILPDGEMI